MLTLPPDRRRVGPHGFQILLLRGPPLGELAWPVSATTPAALASGAHRDLETTTAAHEGASIGGTIVAVGEAEAAGGAAFEHRDGAVVLGFTTRMIR